jgi:predicted signal transduction protein with EAL and GGDEF domain
VALDDFGTGYASLSHLKQFPVNVIKIDHSFVSDVETDAGNAAIVKAVLSLGQSLESEWLPKALKPRRRRRFSGSTAVTWDRATISGAPCRRARQSIS